jgi:hypothetical protein
MRKLILLFLFVFFTIFSNAQQKYRCVFADTMISLMTDSLFRDNATKKNLSIKAIEKILEQYKTNPPSKYYVKTVRAGKDQTIISLDKGSVGGDFTRKIFDSLLYKNDELFNEAPTSSGFSETPWNYPKRAYRGTGKKLSILGYECDEFISTDSCCYLWITTELPEYINPGARTNNVKGAVLGFKLTYTETSTRSMLVKLEKVL